MRLGVRVRLFDLRVRVFALGFPSFFFRVRVFRARGFRVRVPDLRSWGLWFRR